MKIACSKENLLEGINIVQKAVPSKSPLPVLEGILLEANDVFKMTGNDLEMGIECYVDAYISRPGSIVVNSKMFGEIVRRLPNSEVFIECKENETVVIDCESSHFEIKGLSPTGFPALATIEKENNLRISQNVIKDMIRQTLFAVSTDENRPILTGTLIECKDNSITFVSIDGYRLAMRRSPSNCVSEERSVVVPGKTLNEISKIIQNVDDEMDIYSTSSQIMFDLGNCKIVSRLIEGEFLNYNSIIPKEHETKITIDTKEFLSCLERASLVITSDERRYPVNFDISNDRMVITTNTDVGNAREEIKLEMEGSDVDIAFNPRYFIEALKVIDDETVDVYFTTEIGPSTIKPVDRDDFAYLVLPIRK
jgi:DNA polymerase-3 subunit beta